MHLLNGNGKIDVRVAGGPGAHVHAVTHWRRGRASDIHFAVTTVSPNEYYVCAMWRGSGQCGESGYRGAALTWHFLQIFSLFHHGTDATADLTAELPANVVVDATTSNGSVAVNGSAAGVRARVNNGMVSASHISGPINLHTTNGEIHFAVDSLGPADSIDISTVNGVIQGQLPAQTDGVWDLHVSNGSVHTDFALASQSARRRSGHFAGQIGSSTRPVRIRATNGMIAVNRLTTSVAPLPPTPPVMPVVKKP